MTKLELLEKLYTIKFQLSELEDNIHTLIEDVDEFPVEEDISESIEDIVEDDIPF